MRRDCDFLLRAGLHTIAALGNSLVGLAATYSALGRHQDAMMMQEKALEFRLRVLPEHHPDIGAM